VWGGEYRIVNDDLRNTNNAFLLVPERATIGIGDLFAQDTFAMLDTLKLTIGMKIENNTLSGTDVLPNLRLGWTVSKNVFLWAAVSRAVRDPSRLDKDLTAPAVLALAPNFRTEKLIAYELGYRGEPTSTTTLSVTLYYMTYDDLRTTSDSTTAGYLFQLVNGGEGNTYGVEAWGDWRPLPWWRLSTGVNLEHKNLHTKPGVTDISHGQSWGYDPAYQLSLRSSVNVTANVTLDAGIKAVSGLSYVPIKNYINNDASIGWQANERLRLSLSGYNLLGPRHAETLTPGNPTFRTGRSIYLGLRWTF
jgi:iron complex outermembrane receptor protein